MDLKEIRCDIVDWIKLAKGMFVITTRLLSVDGDKLIKQLKDYRLNKNGPDPST